MSPVVLDGPGEPTLGVADVALRWLVDALEAAGDADPPVPTVPPGCQPPAKWTRLSRIVELRVTPRVRHSRDADADTADVETLVAVIVGDEAISGDRYAALRAAGVVQRALDEHGRREQVQLAPGDGRMATLAMGRAAVEDAGDVSDNRNIRLLAVRVSGTAHVQ